MQIKYQIKNGIDHSPVLQREVLEHEGIWYRRIFWWVNRDGTMAEQCSPPVWQEQIHNGDFHTIIDPARVNGLEMLREEIGEN